MNTLQLLDTICDAALKSNLPKQITLVFDGKQQAAFEQDMKDTYGSLSWGVKDDQPFQRLSYNDFDFYIFCIENFE